MGDRVNVSIKGAFGNKISRVCFYIHSMPNNFLNALKNALAKKDRWNDPSYLGGIIYDHIRSVYGSYIGISSILGDKSDNSVIYIDTDSQMVSFKGKKDRSGKWSFDEWVGMKDEIFQSNVVNVFTGQSVIPAKTTSKASQVKNPSAARIENGDIQCKACGKVLVSSRDYREFATSGIADRQLDMLVDTHQKQCPANGLLDNESFVIDKKESKTAYSYIHNFLMEAGRKRIDTGQQSFNFDREEPTQTQEQGFWDDAEIITILNSGEQTHIPTELIKNILDDPSCSKTPEFKYKLLTCEVFLSEIATNIIEYSRDFKYDIIKDFICNIPDKIFSRNQTLPLPTKRDNDLWINYTYYPEERKRQIVIMDTQEK